MSIKRKLQRSSTALTKRHEPPVLIVRPHNPENLTCQQTDIFIDKAVIRGIAECKMYASKVPELARNSAIQAFLLGHTKKTHIFFLDDDSTPENDYAIEVLMRHKKPVICAPTPICRYDPDNKHFNFLWNTIVTKDGHTEEKPQLENIGPDELPKKLFKCHRTGGTGLLVHRDVLEKLQSPYQMTTYNDNWTDVTKSEDIYFCDKIRKAGFDIWADGNTVCHHYHRLDILDMFVVYEAALRDTP
ncbi:MAG: hypothetical protein ABIF19_09205 [Planctomycetota bacterium]